MTGRIVFEKITDISDKFLEEAAFIPETEGYPVKSRRGLGNSGFSRFMNSGWGVAMICCLVAVATVAGILSWGHMAGTPANLPPAGTVGEDTDDSAESVDDTRPDPPELETTMPIIGEDFEPELSFSLGYMDSVYYDFSIDVKGLQAGRSINLEITMTNKGEDFAYMGSTDSFHIEYAALVPSGGAYEDGYACEIYDNMNYGQVSVPLGRQGSYEATFHIPKDAPLGKYDLVVGFWSCEKVFEDVVIVMPDIDLSEEEAIAFADAEIKQRTNLTDLSPYRVSATCLPNGVWELEYRVYIQGYPTMEEIRVYLSTDGTVISFSVNDGYLGRFAQYIPYVTAEMVTEAVEKLGDVDEAELYLDFYYDQGYYLCIGYLVSEFHGDCGTIEFVHEPIWRLPEDSEKTER